MRQIQSATDASSRRNAERKFEIPIPRRKHLWANVKVDEYGYIWATEPTDFYNNRPHGHKCLIISPNGEYLGDIIWPDIEGGIMFVPSRGLLLVRVVDDVTGAQNIHVYRINSNVAGFNYP